MSSHVPTSTLSEDQHNAGLQGDTQMRRCAILKLAGKDKRRKSFIFFKQLPNVALEKKDIVLNGKETKVQGKKKVRWKERWGYGARLLAQISRHQSIS